MRSLPCLLALTALSCTPRKHALQPLAGSVLTVGQADSMVVWREYDRILIRVTGRAAVAISAECHQGRNAAMTFDLAEDCSLIRNDTIVSVTASKVQNSVNPCESWRDLRDDEGLTYIDDQHVARIGQCSYHGTIALSVGSQDIAFRRDVGAQ